MRKFSVRPVLTLRGRSFKGLRGWSGKPFHPPLTDFPIAAYVFAAGFDVASTLGGRDRTWARELGHAATVTLIAGTGIAVLAAVTGLVDRQRSSKPGTQARRTINTHATIMGTVMALAVADIAWRVADHDTATATPTGIAILSVVIAILVSLGATYGGNLVDDYGFNVETASDHPVWHVSEVDVFPGRHDDEPKVPAAPEPATPAVGAITPPASPATLERAR